MSDIYQITLTTQTGETFTAFGIALIHSQER